MTSNEQQSKIKFLHNKYGENIFPLERILFVGSSEYKSDVLQEIYSQSTLHKDERLVLIEDNAHVMASVERLNNPQIRSFVISDFL